MMKRVKDDLSKNPEHIKKGGSTEGKVPVKVGRLTWILLPDNLTEEQKKARIERYIKRYNKNSEHFEL